MFPDIHFTPQEIRLMRVLADGLPHHGRTQLKPLLEDGELNAGHGALNAAISRLRTKLLRRHETIVCELKGTKVCFRYVKLVSAPSQPASV